MGSKYYMTKGNIEFYYDKGNVMYDKEDIEDVKMETRFEVHSLIPGIEFLEMVRDRTIEDKDGKLKNVFIAGYNSNLGLRGNGFCQGGYIVDMSMFEQICKEFNKVEVNWESR